MTNGANRRYSNADCRMEIVDWEAKHADPQARGKLPELDLVKAGTFSFIDAAVVKRREHERTSKVFTDVVRGAIADTCREKIPNFVDLMGARRASRHPANS